LQVHPFAGVQDSRVFGTRFTSLWNKIHMFLKSWKNLDILGTVSCLTLLFFYLYLYSFWSFFEKLEEFRYFGNS